MSKRQTNKANRQNLIVRNAARFFSSVGYDLTTIDMIAERSNVSPATIYNHFKNKTGLLFAVLTEESARVRKIGKNLIARRQQADANIIYRLIELYVDHPMEFMNKSCWRQALAASTASSNKKFIQEYQKAEQQLQEQVINLMHSLYEEQVFIAQVDPQSLGEIICNNVDRMFTDFISDEGMSFEVLKDTLNKQMSALITLALKQN